MNRTTQTLFDLAESGYQGWWLWMLCVFALIASIGHVVYQMRHPRSGILAVPIEALVVCTIMVDLLVLWAAWTPYSEYRDFRAQEKSGEYMAEEGEIKSLLFQNGKNKVFRFEVNNVVFIAEESTILFTDLFDNFMSQKITEGMNVRIFYTPYGGDKAILRMELK